MRLETFFEKFELFADAPNAVAKMRELVLELAVQGQLIEQDNSDVPALVSLRKSTKSIRALSTIDINSVPSGWASIPLGCAIASNTGGGTPSKQNSAYWNGPIPWASVKDIQSEKYLTTTIDSTTEEGLKNSSSNLIPTNRLLVVTRMGLGKLAINKMPVAINQDLRAIEPNEALDLDYAYLLFKALKLIGKGVTVKGVTVEALHSMPVTLPPLAEQKRIVAKVDEMMALCDRLEAQQQESETRHATLARASLAHFAEASTTANLDFLFHRSYPITPGDLRKTILTLAVQGKLVLQDPNDEPVGSLANSRNVKSAPTTNGGDAAFEVPTKWRWTQLGQVSDLINGDRSKNYPNKAEYVREGVPWINTGHIEPNGTLSIDSMHYIARKKFDSLRSGKVQKGDLVYCLRGATLGKTAIITQFDEGAIASSLVIIRLSSAVDPKFAYLVLTSPLGRKQIFQFDNGSAQPNLSANSVKKYLFPLPPIAEQRRIVAKVDQLMALVDQLEAQLSQAKTKSAALLDAVIHELLNPTAEVIDLASYRAAIGCYAIQKMQDKPYFGRTAAMKVLYLAEAHIGLGLNFQPERKAAGPLDSWIYSFEDQGKQKNWFKVFETPISDGKTKIEYRAGTAIGQKSGLVEKILSADQRKEFDRLLGLFSDKTTEEAEIIATLFAAWNDFLIDGHTPSDDEVVREVRENWHQKKARFTPAQLNQWIGWLRRSNLIPQGRLPRTVYQQQLLTN